jgi:hypothetical protein
MLSTAGKEIPTPDEAEVFQFNFVKDGEDYGKVTLTIDDSSNLIVYYSDDVADSEKETSGSGDLSWYGLLNQLKRFAQRYQLSFELRNTDNLKSDMAKRDYMKKQDQISESKHHSMAEGSEYTEPKLGTIKANLMLSKEPTVQVKVFKHNTLRGDSYWVTKEVRTFKTMDQAQAYVDRINNQDVAEGLEDNKQYFQNLHDWHLAVSKIPHDRFESVTGRVYNNGEVVAYWDHGLHSKGGWIKGQQDVDEGETWAKHNNPRAGGMSKKSVKSYRRSHPGSKIQTAVTTKPSKLKKGSKAAARRKSFCARMRGMKKHRTGAKTARDPNSNINKSLRRWNCESVQELQELVMIAEQFIKNNK